MISFIAGFSIGVLIGIFIMSVLIIAKDTDDKE